MDPRKEGKERGGAGGPSVLQAPRLALEVAEAQSHAASPQRAQAEPRHRGQPYPPRRGWAAPRRGPGAWTGEEGSPRRERTGPRPRAQLRFPSRLFKALYVVQIFILAGEGLRAGAGWGHWLSPQSHFSLQLPPRAPSRGCRVPGSPGHKAQSPGRPFSSLSSLCTFRVNPAFEPMTNSKTHPPKKNPTNKPKNPTQPNYVPSNDFQSCACTLFEKLYIPSPILISNTFHHRFKYLKRI